MLTKTHHCIFTHYDSEVEGLNCAVIIGGRILYVQKIRFPLTVLHCLSAFLSQMWRHGGRDPDMSIRGGEDEASVFLNNALHL